MAGNLERLCKRVGPELENAGAVEDKELRVRLMRFTDQKSIRAYSRVYRDTVGD